MNTKEILPFPILVVLTLALTLATFMQVLDTTIANVSIPSIAGNLGVAPTQGTWVITAFGISNAIAMPLTGWFAKRFGEVKLFVLSTALFSLTSFACGMAPNFETLIIGRVIQGAVAAPMMPLSQSLLLANYPADKKGLALAFWAMTATIGPIAGPLLGGYITDNFNWSWIFYINIPVGILSSFLVWQLLKDRETEVSKSPIDYIGLSLLIIGVGSLQILLDNGNDLDWFSSSKIITLTILASVGIVFFIIWELFDDNPVVDLKLFKDRNFSVGTIAISTGYAVFLGGGVIFPLWLQMQLGYTAFWAGFASAAVGVFAFLLSPVVGANMHKFNLRVVVTISFTLFALSYYMMSNFNTQIDLFHVSFPRLIMGIAMAMFFVPLTSIIISQLQGNQIASAMGLVNFLRILGGSLGTSIGVTMWERLGSANHAQLSEHITHFSQQTDRTLNSLKTLTNSPIAYVDHLVNRQAMTIANNDILIFSGYIFLALIPLLWLAKPPFMTSKPK